MAPNPSALMAPKRKAKAEAPADKPERGKKAKPSNDAQASAAVEGIVIEAWCEITYCQ